MGTLDNTYGPAGSYETTNHVPSQEVHRTFILGHDLPYMERSPEKPPLVLSSTKVLWEFGLVVGFPRVHILLISGFTLPRKLMQVTYWTGKFGYVQILSSLTYLQYSTIPIRRNLRLEAPFGHLADTTIILF